MVPHTIQQVLMMATASQPMTVAQLTGQIKDCLEGNFPQVAVVGELSNVVAAASGHVYLNLKDDRSQIRGVMWKSKASRLRFDLHDGLAVVAHGAVEVYAPRGQYQLIIDRLVPDGIGPLELAYQQLKEKLAAEGLFEADRKQPIEAIPTSVALVTSPTSAAVRDMIQVMTRRWPACRIIVVPCPVQGDRAAGAIAKALAAADKLECDTIICGRGGGSLEDLWAFNEEPVARAIAACNTPVISAVGHETDVTIADFVADRRALTPSEAAELAVPDREEMRAALSGASQRMIHVTTSRLRWSRERLDEIRSRRAFARPLDLIHDRSRQVDEHAERLTRAADRNLERARSRVSELATTLDALSPLRTLARGYSVTTTTSGKVVRSITDVLKGDELRTRLQDGHITHTVDNVEAE